MLTDVNKERIASFFRDRLPSDP